MQSGMRTPSAELVLVPKTMLARMYALLLNHDEREGARSLDRIETHAVRREFEEMLSRVAPGMVLEVSLTRADAEKTPTEFPKAADVAKSKGEKS